MKKESKMTEEQIELAATKLADWFFKFFQRNDVYLTKDNKIKIRKR